MSDPAPDTAPDSAAPDERDARIAELEAELSAAREHFTPGPVPSSGGAFEPDTELATGLGNPPFEPAAPLAPVGPDPEVSDSSSETSEPAAPDLKVGDVVEYATTNPADETVTVQHGIITDLVHDGERLVHVLVSWFAPGRAQLPPDAEGLTKK